MAAETRARGYRYFGVADHSRSATYAGGLSLEQIEEQHALADALNPRHRGKFRIFKGIESDILVDGSLDYPEDILASFDFVVASVHSRFGSIGRTQTDGSFAQSRILTPPFSGHMTGRMLHAPARLRGRY